MILLQLIVFLYYRGGSVVKVHDNLDWAIHFIKLMKNNNSFYSFDANVNFLNGVSRIKLPSNISVQNLIYYYMPTISGYFTVYFLKIFIGLFSYILLLKEVFDKDRYQKYFNFIVLTGFMFAMLPTLPFTYFANVTIPLIAYLLVRTYKQPKKVINYVFVFLYPTLSHLMNYGLFICGALFVFLIYDLIKNKSLKLLPAFFLIIMGYLIVEYRLVYDIFLSDIPTIRDEFNLPAFNSSKTLFQWFVLLVNGDSHAMILAKNFVFPISMIFLLYYNIKKYKNKHKLLNPPNLIFMLIAFNSFCMYLFYSYILHDIIDKVIPVLADVNFGRMQHFNTLLWYILLLYLVIFVSKKSKIAATIICVVQIMIIIFSPYGYNDFANTLKQSDNSILQKVYRSIDAETAYLTFDEYYSEVLFEEIKEDINYNGEWSVAFKMKPSVLSYNDISTLDGHLSHYRLSYKNDFRELCKEQMEAHDMLGDFDYWGVRAYIPSKSNRPSTSKYVIDKMQVGEELLLNMDKFKSLDGRYIFSNGEILNTDSLGIKLLDVYWHDVSKYKIYVYCVD